MEKRAKKKMVGEEEEGNEGEGWRAEEKITVSENHKVVHGSCLRLNVIRVTNYSLPRACILVHNHKPLHTQMSTQKSTNIPVIIVCTHLGSLYKVRHYSNT